VFFFGKGIAVTTKHLKIGRAVLITIVVKQHLIIAPAQRSLY